MILSSNTCLIYIYLYDIHKTQKVCQGSKISSNIANIFLWNFIMNFEWIQIYSIAKNNNKYKQRNHCYTFYKAVRRIIVPFDLWSLLVRALLFFLFFCIFMMITIIFMLCMLNINNNNILLFGALWTLNTYYVYHCRLSPLCSIYFKISMCFKTSLFSFARDFLNSDLTLSQIYNHKIQHQHINFN